MALHFQYLWHFLCSFHALKIESYQMIPVLTTAVHNVRYVMFLKLQTHTRKTNRTAALLLRTDALYTSISN